MSLRTSQAMLMSVSRGRLTQLTLWFFVSKRQRIMVSVLSLIWSTPTKSMVYTPSARCRADALVTLNGVPSGMGSGVGSGVGMGVGSGAAVSSGSAGADFSMASVVSGPSASAMIISGGFSQRRYSRPEKTPSSKTMLIT